MVYRGEALVTGHPIITTDHGGFREPIGKMSMDLEYRFVIQKRLLMQ